MQTITVKEAAAGRTVLRCDWHHCRSRMMPAAPARLFSQPRGSHSVWRDIVRLCASVIRDGKIMRLLAAYRTQPSGRLVSAGPAVRGPVCPARPADCVMRA